MGSDAVSAGAGVASGAPDAVLFGVDWQPRALLRAQLIEEGLTVVAVDSVPMLIRALTPELRPRAVVIDLHGLDRPAEVVQAVGAVIPHDRVVVLTALGTVPPDALAARHFRVVSRPVAIEDVARVVHRVIESTPRDAAPRQ